MRSIWIAVLALCAGLAHVEGVRAGETAKGWIGVRAETVTAKLVEDLSLAMEYGALVTAVEDDGPAAKAELQKGDVVYSLSGQEIRSAEALLAAVEKLEPGTKAKLSVARGRQFRKLELTVVAQPEPIVAAEAASVQGEPLLWLDPGGHMAMINAVVFTPDGGQLVSASDDKTIRVWDVASGKTVRIIRGEAGAGQEGKLYAIALSPDGKWLAVGGFFYGSGDERAPIRLYDFASGRLAALLKGHENVVLGLAFSPDGRRLISGSSDTTAIMWDVMTGKALHKLKGHRAEIYAVSFTPDGARGVTGSLDHELRLWSVEDGALLKIMTGHVDKVRSLAASPDGNIASGDASGEIRLWDGRTGAFLKTLAKQETSVGVLSFGPDGKTLLSGIAKDLEDENPYGANVYDAASGREITTYREHDNIVLAAAIDPDGRWAVTGGFYGEIHIWDLRTGARRQGSDGRPLALGGTGHPVWATGISADGRQIAWGNEDGGVNEGPLQRALTLPLGQTALSGSRELDAEAARSFRRAEARHGEWSLSHRKGGNYGGDDAILDVKQGGKVWASIERGPTDGYRHRAYSFTPDGGTIISGGSNGYLAAYDLNGENLGDFIGHEGDVWAVAPSPDGRYLVSGANDQTTRLWNLKTRELLITLFHGSDGEWVMWTPQGFYAASPGGAKLIAWQLNKGPERAACAMTADQVAKARHRPALIARAIELASAWEAVRESGEPALHWEDCAPAIHLVDPPRLENKGRTTLTVAFEPNVLPLAGVDVFVGASRVETREVAPPSPLSKEGFSLKAYDVALGRGPNKITIVAHNKTGDSQALVHHVFQRGQGDLVEGALRVLAIGVNRYPSANARYADLHYAVADARDFAKAAKAEMRRRNQAASVTMLASGAGGDHEPTKANIQAALKALEDAGEKDTVVLFIAGHGERKGDRYYFLPADAVKKEGDGPGQGDNLLDWEAIQEALTRTRGTHILFVDTCHSDGAYHTTLSRDALQRFLAYTATTPFSATGAAPSAIEEDGHGHFTRAALAGLKGGAEDREEHTVRAYELGAYIVREVRKRTQGGQEPGFYPGLGDVVLVKRGE